MGRPRLFDRDAALRSAMNVFHAKGFAGASLDDLLRAMKIGRQSLYDSFGDKRRLYHAAVALYQHESVAAHIARLRAPASPLAGIEALLLGLTPEAQAERERGCLGIFAIAEFGTGDCELMLLRESAGAAVRRALAARVEEARALGEVPPALTPERAAAFIATVMQGLQVGARAGSPPAALRDVIAVTIDMLKA